MVQILEVLQAILKEWIGFSATTPGKSKTKKNLSLFFFASIYLRLKKIHQY